MFKVSYNKTFPICYLYKNKTQKKFYTVSLSKNYVTLRRKHFFDNIRHMRKLGLFFPRNKTKTETSNLHFKLGKPIKNFFIFLIEIGNYFLGDTQSTKAQAKKTSPLKIK